MPNPDDLIEIGDLDHLETVQGEDQVVVEKSSDGKTYRADKDSFKGDKGLEWQGSWSAGTYQTDDAVENNGSAWVANKETTDEPSDSSEDWDLLAAKGEKGDTGEQGEQGIQGEKGDTGLNWQGTWSAGNYEEDDAVEHEGSAWIATIGTSEEPSGSANDWDLLAAKGDKGDTGATGPKGDKGDTGDTGPQGEKGLNWQGAWSAGTYQVDDAVEHNGSAWVATAETTQEPSGSATEWDLLTAKGDKGDKGDTGDTGPKGDKGDTGDFNNKWQGAWSAGTYQEGQVVEHSGSSWIATVETTEEPSDTATDWELVAQAGADGEGSGDVSGPASSVNGEVALFDGTTGKLIKRATGSGFVKATSGVFSTQTDVGLSDIESIATGRILGRVTAGSGVVEQLTATQMRTLLNIEDGAEVNDVDSVFGRTGAVTAQSNDYTWAQIDKTTSDIADIASKSHTSLTDVGTNTHAQIDTHIGNADAHKGQKNSIELDTGDLQLSGDQASPGNDKVYGTDGSGTKGWRDETKKLNINAQTGTSYTLALGDSGKLVTLTNSSAITLTVPPNSSVAFSTGTQITLSQNGAGQVTVAGGSGVTVQTPETLKLADQWSTASLIKVGTDEWILAGRLETA